MAILSMPTTPKMRSVTMTFRAHTQTFGESLSGAVQTYGLAGSRWAAQYELPPMKRADAAAWCAFLCQLNGRAGRFYGGDPSGETARGASAGTIKIIPCRPEADHPLTLLHTYGWTTVGIVLYAGDYVAWDAPSGRRELHIITADVTTPNGYPYGDEGYGEGDYGYREADISIEPPLREVPVADAAVIVNSPTCVMRLVDDEQAAWDIQTAMVYGIRFAAEEVWP